MKDIIIQNDQKYIYLYRLILTLSQYYTYLMERDNQPNNISLVLGGYSTEFKAQDGQIIMTLN